MYSSYWFISTAIAITYTNQNNSDMQTMRDSIDTDIIYDFSLAILPNQSINLYGM